MKSQQSSLPGRLLCFMVSCVILFVTGTHCTALAERQQIMAPRQRIEPKVIKAADQNQWAQKMIEVRTRTAELLAKRDTVEAGEKILYERLVATMWTDLVNQYPVEFDWFIQDLKVPPQRWTSAEDSSQIETELISRIAEQLGNAGTQFIKKLKSWETNPEGIGSFERLSLYLDACRQRRAIRLNSMVQTYPHIIFTKHYDLGGSHYAYTEGQSDAQQEAHFVAGSALCRLDMNGIWGTCRTLLEDPKGVIRDPDVSYDGTDVLFAWKKSRHEDDYHLYEYDTTNHQFYSITEGLGLSDYEGIYLPNGDIIFNSTRCVQTVDCFWTEVSNLYTCAADGDFLRRLSFDQVHTNYPQMLDDGRVIYTRWDYNDRGQIFPQPLFQMNTDGTAQTEFYGNNSWFPTTIMHARGIPGTKKLVAVLSGHHSPQKGKLALIDASRGRQENEGVQLIAPIRKTDAVRVDAYGQDGEQFQYPYPINETEYIVGFRPTGGLGYERFGLYWMDIDGRRELLACDTSVSCSQPVPLKKRPIPHLRPNLVDYTKDYGTYYVQDVYEGPGLEGIERGKAKNLRVVTIEFRPAGIGMNGSHGPGGGALSSTPPAIDNGSWDVKKVLGTTTIHEDGSAMFTVPAQTPVYFQVLDEKNHVIQSMRSWSTLQPGEAFSCVGCHEHKNEAPAAGMKTTQAMAAGPETLKPFYGPTRGFSYPREIQPILDQNCIQCHDQRPQNKTKRERGKVFSLLGAENVDAKAKRKWSDSYLALTNKGRPNKMVYWNQVQSVPSMLPPYTAGAAKSKLIKILEKGHKGVKLTGEQMDKIACWIDLLVPYCGDYTEANAWNEAEVKMYNHFVEKRRTQEELEKENIRRYLENQKN